VHPFEGLLLILHVSTLTLQRAVAVFYEVLVGLASARLLADLANGHAALQIDLVEVLRLQTHVEPRLLFFSLAHERLLAREVEEFPSDFQLSILLVHVTRKVVLDARTAAHSERYSRSLPLERGARFVPLLGDHVGGELDVVQAVDAVDVADGVDEGHHVLLLVEPELEGLLLFPLLSSSQLERLLLVEGVFRASMLDSTAFHLQEVPLSDAYFRPHRAARVFFEGLRFFNAEVLAPELLEHLQVLRLEVFRGVGALGDVLEQVDDAQNTVVEDLSVVIADVLVFLVFFLEVLFVAVLTVQGSEFLFFVELFFLVVVLQAVLTLLGLVDAPVIELPDFDLDGLVHFVEGAHLFREVLVSLLPEEVTLSLGRASRRNLAGQVTLGVHRRVEAPVLPLKQIVFHVTRPLLLPLPEVGVVQQVKQFFAVD